LRAIAGSEPAAMALGINVARYKLLAFMISALYGSATGSLFAHFIGFISPEVFATTMVVSSFTMLYLGGIGTVAGPIVGAVIVSLLPELLRGLKEWQDVVYVVILISMLIYAPKGIAGFLDRLFRRGES
jgi:branched-chain amino acid transport system permease protein